MNIEVQDFVQDLRYAIRTLAKGRGAILFAIVALGLAIGANSTIFSFVSAILIRPLPYPDPDRLMLVWETKLSKGMRRQQVSPADYEDLIAHNQVFAQVGAIQNRSCALTGQDLPERVETAEVSPSIFRMLGMKPSLGRSFAPDEDEPSKNSVAILGDGLWRRRFGANRGILGSAIILDGKNYTVIGIAPPGFRVVDGTSELWIPYTADPVELLPRNRGDRILKMLARLRPGVTRRQAEMQMQSVFRRIEELDPQIDGYSAEVVPLSEQLVSNLRPTLWMLLGAVAFILLIACVNVANILLMRANAREKEIAIRAAVGAEPGRIVRQLLTESVVLAILGGLLGLFLAYVSLKVLIKLAPSNIPRLEEISIDWRVLTFSLGVSVFSGIVFGLAPAWSSIKTDLNSILRSSGRGSTEHRTRSRLRDALAICQISCCAALLIGAGLLIHSFMRLEQVKPGFRSDHILTMQISLPPARYPGLRVGLFYKQLLDRLRTMAGVESAGVCRFLPLAGSDASLNFQIEGQPPLPPADQPRAKFRAADGAYFTALGMPLLRGRLFDRSDDEHSPLVVIINQMAARRYWPNEDPIGKRIQSGIDKRWSTIIGVVGNVKHTGLDAETNPETYYHYLQIPPQAVAIAESTMAVVIRTRTDPAALVSAARGQVRMLDPEQPVFDLRSMDDVLRSSVAQPRFRAVLLSLFAGVALLLAAIGIYAVIGYSVTQRTSELGIRMALGAEPVDILRRVVSHGVVLAIAGLGIGIALATALAHLISRLLFGVAATDWMTFGAVSLVLLPVAAASSWIPALRATRIDPLIALRSE